MDNPSKLEQEKLKAKEWFSQTYEQTMQFNQEDLLKLLLYKLHELETKVNRINEKV